MIILKQTLIRFAVRLIESMPNFITFHKKLIILTTFVVKRIENCDHNMVIADNGSHCTRCGADYYEIIDFKYERKEFLISRDILNGYYSGRVEKLFKQHQTGDMYVRENDRS